MSQDYSTLSLSTDEDPSILIKHLQALQQNISTTQRQIANTNKLIKQNISQIHHLQKFHIYINLYSRTSPLQSFKSYCQLLGIDFSLQITNEMYQSFFGVSLFQLTKEDQLLVKQNIGFWQKINKVEMNIMDMQNEMNCLERDKERLEKREMQLKRLYDDVLMNYKEMFNVDVRMIR